MKMNDLHLINIFDEKSIMINYESLEKSNCNKVAIRISEFFGEDLKPSVPWFLT